jgi:outer membrane protein assembly factor BamB
MPRALTATLLALGVTACRAIPLNEDPTIPPAEANVSLPAVYSVAWRTPLVKIGLLEYQPSETATPAVDPDTERVIVSTRDGHIHCLSPTDGHVEWSFNTYGRPYAGAAIEGGIAYVPGGDGVLYALRVATGEKVWEYQAAEELVTTPTITADRVLIASQSETVFAVERETGKWAWQYRRDAPSGFTIRGTAQPVVSDGQVYMGFADGALVALGLDDGVARWERKLTVSGGTQFLDVDTTVALDGRGHLYAASYKDGIYALDAKSGDIEWSTSRPGITSLLLRGSVLFATGDGSLSALETGKGRALWSVSLSDRTSKGLVNNAGRPMTHARGYVVVPTSTGLAFVEPTSGRVRAMWNPGRGVTATPTRFESSRHGPRLFVLSNLGTLYALDLVSRGG